MATGDAMHTEEAAVFPSSSDENLLNTVMAKFQNSAAPEHRHLCAVVGAMAQVISEQGLPPSRTAYFAATMSTLERQRRASPDDPVTTALCTFLGLLLPKTSPAVLRSKAREALALLVAIAGANSASAGTLKHSFTCISNLLSVSEKGDWPSLSPSFNLLVNHCVDQRPKIRKRAHECTADVLRGFRGSTALAMASEVVLTQFEKSLSTVTKNKKPESTDKVIGKSGSAEALRIVHILNALKLSIHLLNEKSISKLLEHFAKLLELHQPFLSRQILGSLQSLFMDPGADIPVGVLTELLGTLAEMVLEQNRAGDEGMVAARMLTSGLERLYALDPQSCAPKLPLVFQALTGMLALEQEEAVHAASDCLKNLIEKCIDFAVIEQGKASLLSRGKSFSIGPSVIERVSITTASMLDYQFSSAWDVCLQVVAALFEKLGASSYFLMADSVKALADLETLSDENLTCRRQLHRTLGAAIAAMGPAKFLDILSLNLDSNDISNFRVWLMPILRHNIIGAELKYFSEKIVPLTHKLQDRTQQMVAEGKPTAAKKLEAFVQSLWSLFPAFCNFPSDTSQSFGKTAKLIGDALSKEPELRGVICHGMKMLINQNKIMCGMLMKSEANNDDSMSQALNKAAEDRAKALYTHNFAKANLSAIASFSPNFLPLLFNIFIAAPSEKRGDLQVTIGCWASISNGKAVKDFFVSIMQKLLKATREAVEGQKPGGPVPMDLSGPKKEESATSRRCIFMDLALSLLQGLDDGSVGTLFTAVKPTLQDVDGSVQKKGYKVLTGLCKENAGFLASKLDELLELMLTSMPACHFSAKRHRLSCLHHLILYIFKERMQEKENILSSFISEIVLATKEANVKTRNVAYDMLAELGHSLQQEDSDNPQGKLIQFFTMVVGCLAGTTPHMKSAAVRALARLIYEFQDLCYTIPDLLPSVLMLLKSKAREVIKSVLGFLKVVVTRQPVEHLQQNLESIIDGLLLWSNDSKNHFKAKVRVICEILVRRCGLQALAAVMPQDHVKLLSHIRKMKEQKEKQQNGEEKSVHSYASLSKKSKWQHTQVFSDEEMESGMDEDYMDADTMVSGGKSKMTSTRSKNKLKKSNKMLPEDGHGGEDEPLDLLDVKGTRSALSVKTLKRKGYESDDFEMDEVGRLIVLDENAMREKKLMSHSLEGEDDARSSRSKRSKATHTSVTDSKLKSNLGKRRKVNSGWSYTGQEYASSKGKARGDVKRKGKLEPYAYWPLDTKMLNRREGKKAAARKGLASVLSVTNKMKGMSASKAIGVTWTKSRRKQKLHKGGKSK